MVKSQKIQRLYRSTQDLSIGFKLCWTKQYLTLGCQSECKVWELFVVFWSLTNCAFLGSSPARWSSPSHFFCSCLLTCQDTTGSLSKLTTTISRLRQNTKNNTTTTMCVRFTSLLFQPQCYTAKTCVPIMQLQILCKSLN